MSMAYSETHCALLRSAESMSNSGRMATGAHGSMGAQAGAAAPQSADFDSSHCGGGQRVRVSAGSGHARCSLRNRVEPLPRALYPARWRNNSTSNGLLWHSGRACGRWEPPGACAERQREDVGNGCSYTPHAQQIGS